MVRRLTNQVWLGVLAATLSGCAQNAIHGNGSRTVQVFHGTLSIVGDQHEVTVAGGSEVPKMSVLGDGIHVTIEDGAVVKKIEVAGDENEVICPADLSVEYTEAGDQNRLLRR